jgi:peroxiredoxin
MATKESSAAEDRKGGRVAFGRPPRGPERPATAIRVGGRWEASLAVYVVTLLAALPSRLEAAPAPAPNVAELLNQNGIRPIDPPTAAVDFTLDGVDGARHSLKDQQGKWVVLTFFATWCGPCGSEMPSLARLSQTYAGKKLVVLGVATDNDVALVQSYVKQKSLGFPVLVDTTGKVAGQYHASSIPTSYVVDPTGRLVGMSRGARDWARMTTLFDKLLGLPPSASAPAYASQDKVDLPPILKPPTATVVVSDPAPIVDRPLAMEVKIRWSGTFDEYILMPPIVHLPTEVKELNTRAGSSTLDGEQVVTYTIELQPTAPGKFALDPVELRYTPRMEREPVTSRIQGPTIEVEARTVAGLTPMAFASSIIVGLLVAGIGGLLFWYREKRQPKTAPASSRSVFESLSATLEQSRKCRLDGDAAGFLAGLLAIELALTDGDENTRAGLEALVEQTRYGGGSPSPEELQEMERRIERRILAHKPDLNQKQREGIRFAKL